MPVSQCYVFIYKEGEATATPAAHLGFSNDKQCLVQYGKHYARQVQLGIDPITLPCTQDPLTINWEQANSLRDAMPGPFALKILAQAKALPEKGWAQADSLLCALPARIGNLDFRSSPADPEPAIDLPDLADLEEIAHVLAKSEAHHLRKADLGMLMRGLGTGGSRPNCTIYHEGSLWLAKFARNNETPHAIRIAHALLCLADQCGLDVAPTKQCSLGKTDCLVQERFDREMLDNGFGRSGYFSAVSLLAAVIRKEQKAGCLALADQIRRICPEYLQEFFHRLLFSLILGCSGDILDNTGFLHSSGLVRLAPAFSFTLPPMNAAHQKKASELQTFSAQISNLLDSSERFGISAHLAKNMLAGLLAQLSQWQEAFALCSVPEQSTAMFAQHIKGHLAEAQESLSRKA